jgi:hypothetical protein
MIWFVDCPAYITRPAATRTITYRCEGWFTLNVRAITPRARKICRSTRGKQLVGGSKASRWITIAISPGSRESGIPDEKKLQSGVRKAKSLGVANREAWRHR